VKFWAGFWRKKFIIIFIFICVVIGVIVGIIQVILSTDDNTDGTNDDSLSTKLSMKPVPSPSTLTLVPTMMSEITCGITFVGDTTGVKKIEKNACGDVSLLIPLPGKVIRYVGTGDVVTLTTCNKATHEFGYNSRIRVYTNKEVCIDGNDDDIRCNISEKLSTVSFQSEKGTIYNILVDSPRTEGGKFELDSTCREKHSAGEAPAGAREGGVTLFVYSDDDN